jgi:hypothetical protein
MGLSAGWLLLRAARADQGLTRLETFVFSLAVGLNLLATYVLLAGLAGLLHFAVMAVPGMLTVATALGLCIRLCKANRILDFGFWILDSVSNPKTKDQRPKTKDLNPKSKIQNPKSEGPWWAGGRHAGLDPPYNRLWLWLAAPFLAVIVLGAMLPPVEFDVREYHLQVPKEFYQQGRITHLPHNVYGNMPLGTEMLSLLAMVLSGDWWLGALAGKTVTALMAPLTALGLLAAGRRFFSAPAGAAAAALYLSTPWIVRISTAGLVDGAAGCYLLLAVYAMLLWQQGTGSGQQGASRVGQARVSERRPTSSASPVGNALCGVPGVGKGVVPLSPTERRGGRFLQRFTVNLALSRLLLAGYLAGCAAATKYPGLLFVVLPLTAWSGLAGSRVGQARVSERSPNSAAGSWWGCGRQGGLDPPYTWRTAGGRLAIFLAAAALACGPWLVKNAVLAGNPTYPLLYEVFGGKSWTAEKNDRWNHVHRPHDFSPSALAASLVQVGLTSEWLSPLVVPLAALALAVRRHRAVVVRLWVLFGYVIAAWWLLTHRIDRFWLPALPLLCLAAGLGVCWSPQKSWRWGVAGLLTVVLLGNFAVVSSGGPVGDNRYFVSLGRLRDDPLRVTAWHRYFNREVSHGRVLLVGDAEPFDLEMPVLYSTCFDDSPFELLSKGRTAAEAWSGLRAKGITHVYVDWGEIERYRRSGYGFSAYFRPEVFRRLVDKGVLRSLPEIEGDPGRGYEVIGGTGDAGAGRGGEQEKRRRGEGEKRRQVISTRLSISASPRAW